MREGTFHNGKAEAATDFFVSLLCEDRMRLNKSRQTSLPLLYSTFTIFASRKQDAVRKSNQVNLLLFSHLSLSLSAGALKIGCIPAVLYDTTAVGHYNIFTVSCHYAKAYARHSKYVVMQN